MDIKVAMQGNLEMVTPTSDAEIIDLGEAYVAYEATQPAAQQLHDISVDTVQTALSEAKAADTSAVSGEADRAAAAQQFRTAFAQARPLLDQAITHLKSKYVANLADLAHWGLTTKVKGTGTSVLKPIGQSALIEFLMAYVAQEESLPAANRIADPPLATMQALAEAIKQTQAVRTAARTRRESGVEVRGAAVQHLLDLLQVAAGTLVLLRFDGRITNDLQQWGFKVVERKAKTKAAPKA